FLEVRMVHHLVQLSGEALVDFADPVLDVGLDVLGNHLARFDYLLQEALEIALGALGLAIILRPSHLDDLIEEVGRLFLSRDWVGSWAFFCGPHDLGSSRWGRGPDEASSTRATAVAFSVWVKTSVKSCSSLSLPSMRQRSCSSSCRMSNNCFSGG